MITRERALIAGMTDYTGVGADVILTHLQGWRDGTAGCIEKLKMYKSQVDRDRARVDKPQQVLNYIVYFIDLFERYLTDFERLLSEIPNGVTTAHIEIVQQIYKSAITEEHSCVVFKEDHIENSMKDESLRFLLDNIYSESRGMVIDYRDLSNLIPRLRTFVGTVPKFEKELEQKFRILYSLSQAQRDFELWTAQGRDIPGYVLGIVFIDVDDFKSLNSKFTESIVDRAILGPIQHLVRDLVNHRGGAYRHGGEELLVLLPNHDLNETVAFAEKVRSRIELQQFEVEDSDAPRVTVSAGVSAWPACGNTLDAVVQAANKAEHAAKNAGKNCVRVSQPA